MIKSVICCWLVIFFSSKVKITVRVTTAFITSVLRMRVRSASVALLARNISWAVHTTHCGCDLVGPMGQSGWVPEFYGRSGERKNTCRCCETLNFGQLIDQCVCSTSSAFDSCSFIGDLKSNLLAGISKF